MDGTGNSTVECEDASSSDDEMIVDLSGVITEADDPDDDVDAGDELGKDDGSSSDAFELAHVKLLPPPPQPPSPSQRDQEPITAGYNLVEKAVVSPQLSPDLQETGYFVCEGAVREEAIAAVL